MSDGMPKLYGDGVHDDRPALQWIIDRGPAADGWIHLPKGRWFLSEGLNLPNGSKLDGGGSAFAFLSKADRRRV